MPLADGPAIASTFDPAAVEASARAIEQKKIGYAEFLRQIMRAGCARYSVFILGGKAMQFRAQRRVLHGALPGPHQLIRPASGSSKRGVMGMAVPIRAVITFALSNYPLTYLTLGLLFAIVAIVRARRPIGPSGIVERLIAWHVFWSIGVGYLYNFVMHGFFGKMSAAFIGWADSPFQFEVATASLGFATVGFLAGIPEASTYVSQRLSGLACSRSERRSAMSIKWQPSIISRRATPASFSIWISLFRHSGHCCYGSSIATAIPMPGRYRHSPRPDARGEAFGPPMPPAPFRWFPTIRLSGRPSARRVYRFTA